jgi:hypothetical protein
VARFDARRVSTATVLVLAGAVWLGCATGCSSQPTAFCATLRKGAPGFNRGASPDAAVRAIDATAAQLAPRDRADLRVIRNYLVVLADPARHPDQAAPAIRAFARAAARLDRRLKSECGTPLSIPPQVFLGGDLKSDGG